VPRRRRQPRCWPAGADTRTHAWRHDGQRQRGREGEKFLSFSPLISPDRAWWGDECRWGNCIDPSKVPFLRSHGERVRLFAFSNAYFLTFCRRREAQPRQTRKKRDEPFVRSLRFAYLRAHVCALCTYERESTTFQSVRRPQVPREREALPGFELRRRERDGNAASCLYFTPLLSSLSRPPLSKQLGPARERALRRRPPPPRRLPHTSAEHVARRTPCE